MKRSSLEGIKRSDELLSDFESSLRALADVIHTAKQDISVNAAVNGNTMYDFQHNFIKMNNAGQSFIDDYYYPEQ